MATKVWIGTTGAYATGSNWAGGVAPVAGDDVRIPAGSGSIDGSDQSATAIADFVVEDGYTGTIGNAATNLKIDPDAFRFSGRGQSFIDLHTAAVSPQVFTTAPAPTGERGLYLIGSGMVTLNVMGGTVGVAARAGETATVATIRVVGSSADVWVGLGCSLTTFHQTDGRAEVRCACTTITVEGGTLYTKEEGAVTTLNVYGGNVYPESTGTISTLNCNGGSTDFTTSGAARTVSSLVLAGGDVAVPGYLTVTAMTRSTSFGLDISSRTRA